MKATRTRIVLAVALWLVALAGVGFFLWGKSEAHAPSGRSAGPRPSRAQSVVVLPAAKEECPASPITTARPANANTAAWSHTWYRSPDARIWASAPGLQSYRPDGDKVLWVKPMGAELLVEGHRLDGVAPPLQVGMACCYPEDFQASGITFPTPGCWEIEARAGGADWRFVVHIP